MISIVLPVSSTHQSVNRCVESILAQQMSEWELIIVTAVPHDFLALEAVVRDDKRITIVELDGGSENFLKNVALNYVRGDYILLTRFNELFYPQRLSEIRTQLICTDVVIDNTVIQLPNKKFNLFSKALISVTARDYAFAKWRPSICFNRSLVSHRWNCGAASEADCLFFLRVLEQHGNSAVLLGNPTHERDLTEAAECFFDPYKLESTYEYCLDEVRKTGLGLKTSQFRRLVEDTMKVRTANNQV